MLALDARVNLGNLFNGLTRRHALTGEEFRSMDDL